MARTNKEFTSIRLVTGVRIVAGFTLVGLIALYFHDRSQTDIGSAFGVFYDGVAIVLLSVVWAFLELKNLLNKKN